VTRVVAACRKTIFLSGLSSELSFIQPVGRGNQSKRAPMRMRYQRSKIRAGMNSSPAVATQSIVLVLLLRVGRHINRPMI